MASRPGPTAPSGSRSTAATRSAGSRPRERSRSTPCPTSDSQPLGITAGPDGALWFTEVRGNKIGRITTSGTITRVRRSHPEQQPPRTSRPGPTAPSGSRSTGQQDRQDHDLGSDHGVRRSHLEQLDPRGHHDRGPTATSGSRSGAATRSAGIRGRRPSTSRRAPAAPASTLTCAYRTPGTPTPTSPSPT